MNSDEEIPIKHNEQSLLFAPPASDKKERGREREREKKESQTQDPTSDDLVEVS